MPPKQGGRYVGQQLPNRIARCQMRQLVRQHGVLLTKIKVIQEARRKRDHRAYHPKRNGPCQAG
jgi:hypothetical protein